MKHLTFILLVTTILGCKQNTKSEFVALNSETNFAQKRTELNQSVLKYVKYKSDIIALTNAIVFDGKGNQANNNQTLIIVNGFFHSIGKSSEVEIPENAKIINLKS